MRFLRFGALLAAILFCGEVQAQLPSGPPSVNNILGLGAGVGPALGVAVGSPGSFVLNGGALGTPSNGVLTNATGLPVSTGLSGLGANVASALANALNSAGGIIGYSGSLGTPTQGVLTNLTGLPISTGVAGLGTNVAALLSQPANAAGGLPTIGTSGATVCLLNASCTWSATQTINLNAASLPASIATTLLHLGGADGTSPRILIEGFAGIPSVLYRRADGTAATPTAVQTGDALGGSAFFGYGATGYSAGARGQITANAAENWSDTAQGTYLHFDTTAKTTTTLLERIRIDDAGNVGIGVTSPTHRLEVNGNSAFTPTLTDANQIGIFVQPINSAVTAGDYLAAYNMTHGTVGTPIAIGTKGNKVGYEFNIITAEAPSDSTGDGHGVGGTIIVSNGASLNGFALATTINTVQANHNGLNISITNNVANTTAVNRGVFVQSAGLNAVADGFALLGVFTVGLDLGTNNIRGLTNIGFSGNANCFIDGSRTDVFTMAGCGSSGGMILYGSGGGTGTDGLIRFRNNGTDNTQGAQIDAGTGASTFGATTLTGDLTFSAANPNITSGGSFIQIPHGIFAFGGTNYFGTLVNFRASIANDGAAYLQVNGGTSGFTYINGSLGVGTNAPGVPLDVVGAIRSSTTVATGCVAIASLPTAGTAGRLMCVNNQTAACPATGVAFTAGGAVVCPAFDNGTAWVGG